MSAEAPRIPDSAGPEFQLFYAQSLRPALLDFEQRARQALRNLGIGMSVVFAALAVTVALRVLFPGVLWAWLPFALSLIVPVVVYVRARRGYRAEFKRRIIAPLATFVHKDLRFVPEGTIPQREFDACRFFLQRPDEYLGEDLIEGRLGETDLRFCEVRARRKKEKENGKTEWEVLFRGFFFVADFHKEFRGMTVVLPDRTERFLGKFAQTLQGLDPRRGQVVKLEDPEFERHFVVYSSDQIQARYILSTSLMQRIVDLRCRMDQPIYLAFVASRVYLAIPCERDRLEPPSMYRHLDFERAPRVRERLMRCLQTYLNDLHFGVKMVEELNLNTRIWTR